MIPGMNPRQMQQMMKQMGVQQVDIDAEKVIIICPDKRIVIDNPQVAKVKMMGQETWQVSGSSRIEELDNTPEITEEDIETVISQTGVTKEQAKEAILASKGDLAEAIMSLKEE